MTQDQLFNNRLERIYGREQATGLPKYRIVRSETQTEKRYGSYDILTQETGIWLGTKRGLVEIKKYWYFQADCWLLERCEPNTNRKDIFHDKYTYEPILPFLDKDNNVLPLNWRAVEFLVSRLERAEKRLVREEDDFAIEEKRLKEEEDKTFGLLDKPDPTKELPTFKSSTLMKGLPSNKAFLTSEKGKICLPQLS